MSWTNSKVFAFAVLDALENNVKLSTDTYYIAVYASNTMTPDNTVATAALTEYNGAASQWVVANEVSSTNYTAGGVQVTPISLTQASNVVTFTSSGAPSWTTVTFTAYGGLVYDQTHSNKGLCYNFFGGAQTVTSGVFTVNFSGSGVATWTC